jgi:hypothetical protein
MISDVVMNANESTAELKVPLGLQLHLVNLFPEELAKVMLLTTLCMPMSKIHFFFYSVGWW